MNKKIKILILLFFFLTLTCTFQSVFAKYVIQSQSVVARLDIDCVSPNFELLNISNTNSDYPNYANSTHTLTFRLKLIEKNIVQNNLNSNTIKFLINNSQVYPLINYFSLVSQNSSEKIYELSVTNLVGDGVLSIEIPEGIVEDKSGLVNSQNIFSTNLTIDNTAPVATFEEVLISDNKSLAKITCNEPVQMISGWNLSDDKKLIYKEFPNKIKYTLPIKDYAQNSSSVLVNIKNATNILLDYGTYDNYSKQTLVSCGDVSSPNTINSGSICKTEVIYFRLYGNIEAASLRARSYLYTYWDEGSYGICPYSELKYYYGYNPWFNYPENALFYHDKYHVQLGGVGLNQKNSKNHNTTKGPLPENIANQYLYGISGIQFYLSDVNDYSVVYQCYVNGIGWLRASSDGEENLYAHDKPISSIRINIVPKSEKQYLINYWNSDSPL